MARKVKHHVHHRVERRRPVRHVKHHRGTGSKSGFKSIFNLGR